MVFAAKTLKVRGLGLEGSHSASHTERYRQEKNSRTPPRGAATCIARLLLMLPRWRKRPAPHEARDMLCLLLRGHVGPKQFNTNRSASVITTGFKDSRVVSVGGRSFDGVYRSGQRQRQRQRQPSKQTTAITATAQQTYCAHWR